MKWDLDSLWKTLAAAWAWLPQIVAGVAAFASFASALINITESKTLERWRERRRAARITRLRHDLAEAEAQSDL
jgi:hypothetical protein